MTDLAALLDTAEAMVNERLAALGVTMKHLPGEHDQDTHGHHGSDSADIPHQVGGRAPKGGAIGPNGLFYPGGSFVGTTDMDKLEKKQRQAAKTYLDRKQEIEPYNYSKPPAIDQSSLYGVVSGHGAKYNRETKKFDVDSIPKKHLDYLDSQFGKGTAQEVLNEIDLFNSGERWFVNQNLAHLRGAVSEKEIAELSYKSIGQVVTAYNDQLTNAVYDVWNGHSDPIDFRRAHRAMLREYAPRSFVEGMREGGIDEIDEEDQAEMQEQVDEWLSTQFPHVNDFAKATGEARKAKEQRPVILDRVAMWVDSLRSLGDMGRAYALQNEKVQWTLGATEQHCDTCLRLSNMKPHRISWFTSRGYIPRQNGSTTLDCGGWLCDCSGKNKKGDTLL